MNARSKVDLQAATAGTTMTSREFNQHTGEAKIAASRGPVFITHRGRPAFVLMSSEDYERLTEKRPFVSILESLADTSPEGDFPYEFERVPWGIRDVDFGEEE